MLMMTLQIKTFLLITFVFFANAVHVFPQDALSNLLSEELERNITELDNSESPPYYISLRVNDKLTYSIRGSYGNITRNNAERERVLHTSMRVGNYELDNTGEIRDDMGAWFEQSNRYVLNIEDSPEDIKTTVWNSIHSNYRDAENRYHRVKANLAIKVEGEDDSDDFSRENPVSYYEPPIDFNTIDFDKYKWEERMRRYSGIFLEYTEIYDAEASIVFEIERRNFVASDGSGFEENRIATRLFISAKAKADDGMELPLHISYFSYFPEDLPPTELIEGDVQKMAETLIALRVAPVAEAYEGPAILSGEAAGVFFHEIFGHRIEGHRLKLSTDGQTFKNRVGEYVLPSHLSVIFDPQQNNYQGEDLYGHYKYDDQGIKGQKVVVVENGILKDFLMSRTPIENFPNSNGHGRAYSGREPVARQSNMFILTENPLSIEDLRLALKQELKKQNKEYGFYFETVRGGFTMTGRFMPNAFNVSPLVVYKVYADEREDELIRGVDLIGTPLAMFSQIMKAGDDYGIFQGNCGAESGWVPVSAVSPSLLVRQIETQRQIQSQDRPFILPPPRNNK